VTAIEIIKAQEFPMKNLRKYREAAGLIQADLANRAGIDRPRLSYAENGHVELSEDEQGRIMKILVAEIRKGQEEARDLLGSLDERLAVAR
jgi:transcriptional regulator with XRE-family HTH domain